MSHFDQLAPDFDSEPRRVAMAAGVAQAMLARLPLAPDATVLDFGAGTGLLTLQLLPHVARVLAVDTSAGMLDVLRGKLAAAGVTQVECVLADLEARPWDREPVDAVVSSMVLHHLGDVSLAVGRLVAAVKPGGWLALADLDTEDGSFHGPDFPETVHLGFERAVVASWLTAAGCVDVRLATAYTHCKTCADGVYREFPLFVATARRPL